ncbi:hypothetical protein GH714_041544 [Hevea brasiliensis]|uniref:Retrotransposon Copia-like N-terminal domain-containing protein n=1 Tax=Hevea brasiliensis TaxID=3981 RepID=A0A6A6MVI2_HEVBR|nr:hypothetical protein GH714_041544 [Hevea brasiliensis]
MIALATLREMSTDFVKLEHFDGGNFLRWQKKMHFLLVTLKVVYVLNTPKPAENENETMQETCNKQKWDNGDEIYRGHILNGMPYALFDVYQNETTAKALWERLEQHSMHMDETIIVCSIINKLPLSWKDIKRAVKPKKEDMSIEQLAKHLCVEEE